MTVEVNGQKHSVKFGYGALRNICKIYGYEKVSGYDKIVKKLKLDKMEDPSFDQLDFIGNLILSGILNANKLAEVTTEDVLDAVMQKEIDTAEVMKEFAESLPKQDKVQPKKGGK